MRCLPILPQRGCSVGSSRSRGPGMHHVARADHVLQRLRVVPVRRVLHRVQVVEVAEELVEAVHGRQEPVQVAEMVLAELPGRIAHRLEHLRDGDRLVGNAERRPGLADRRQAGPDRQLAGDEVRAACRAARLGVIVGEAHALVGQPVEIGRPAGHDPLIVDADIGPADIVAHHDDYIGLRGLGMSPPPSGSKTSNMPHSNPRNCITLPPVTFASLSFVHVNRIY